jgi:hypothetical protein
VAVGLGSIKRNRIDPIPARCRCCGVGSCQVRRATDVAEGVRVGRPDVAELLKVPGAPVIVCAGDKP